MSVKEALPLPPNLLAIAGVQPLELEVAEVSDLGPRMRRLRLAAPGLANFEYQPNQDVMLVLGRNGDRPLSRRYTIRSLDRARGLLELNIVAHGVHGPGARWAASAEPGDRVNGVGPRGKIFLNPQADWHLFLGDETAAPGALAMLEALPPGTRGQAMLEVTEAEDELPSSAAERVRWLHRGQTPATDSRLLVEAASQAELPPGRGHVYIAGEVKLVKAVRDALLARGLAAEQLSPKAYWGRGQANAERGEPDERA